MEEEKETFQMSSEQDVPLTESAAWGAGAGLQESGAGLQESGAGPQESGAGLQGLEPAAPREELAGREAGPGGCEAAPSGQESSGPRAGELTLPRYKFLSGNALKMIALITMLIDHIGAAILEAGVIEGYNNGLLNISYDTAMLCWYVDLCLRAVGRLAFPIYCFLITEGFEHTRSVRKYALRMGVFALVSEIPFDLAFYHSVFHWGHQNVFFTLFIGLLALSCMKRFEREPVPMAFMVAVCAGAAELLNTDYGASGVLAISLLYLLRSDTFKQAVAGAIYFFPWEPPAALAFIPVWLYNGKRGKMKMKYLFYAFYPVHLAVLYLICRVTIGA